jgi:uncharacterized phage-associated protein
MKYNKKYKDVYKIAHTLLFFLQNDMQNFGLTKLMKLFFYADKLHLEKYKKPIFNKPYTKLERGPVPLWTLSLIKKSIRGEKSEVYDLDLQNEAKIFNEFIQTYKTGHYDMVSFKQQDNVEFNEDLFSQSEIEVLTNIAKEFKSLNAEEISDLSHETHAWKSVELNQPIEWRNIVDDTHDKFFINYLQNERLSFRDNLEMFKVEKK